MVSRVTLSPEQIAQNTAYDLNDYIAQSVCQIRINMWKAYCDLYDVVWAADRPLAQQLVLIQTMAATQTSFVSPFDGTTVQTNNYDALFREGLAIVQLVRYKQPDLLRPMAVDVPNGLLQSADKTLTKYINPGWTLDSSFMPVAPVVWVPASLAP